MALEALEGVNDNIINAEDSAADKARKAVANATKAAEGTLAFPMVDKTPRSAKVVDALIYAGIGFITFVGASTVNELIKRQLKKKAVPVPVPGPIA